MSSSERSLFRPYEVRTESGTETPIIGMEMWTGRERAIAWRRRSGRRLRVSETRRKTTTGVDDTVAAKLDAGLIVVDVEVDVDVGVDAAGSLRSCRSGGLVGEGMTIPEEGTRPRPTKK